MKYQLHPNIIDIFVEGEFDRDFISQFLEFHQIEHAASIIPINAVEINDKKLIELGLDLGSNKQRVIALGRIFQESMAHDPSNVTCLVDADCDRLLNRCNAERFVKYTDYTCMEMYLLNKKVLKKFITFTCNLADDHYDEFILHAHQILPSLFLVRALNEEMALRAKIPCYTTGMKKKRDYNSFEFNKYLDGFIINGNLNTRKEEIHSRALALMNTLPKDIREKVNGHDFLTLLFDFADHKNTLKLQSKEQSVIAYGGRLIASLLEIPSLSSENLFVDIQDVIGNRKHMFV